MAFGFNVPFFLALPSEQVAEAAVPAVAGAVEAPVVARRGKSSCERGPSQLNCFL